MGIPVTYLPNRTTYVIRKGDYLRKIIRQNYKRRDGTALTAADVERILAWLYDANKTAIGRDPNIIHAGTALTLGRLAAGSVATATSRPAVAVTKTIDLSSPVNEAAVQSHQTLTVTVKDESGNGIAGKKIRVTITGPAEAAGARVLTPDVATLGRGQATVVVVLGDKPGNYKISVSLAEPAQGESAITQSWTIVGKATEVAQTQNAASGSPLPEHLNADVPGGKPSAFNIKPFFANEGIGFPMPTVDPSFRLEIVKLGEVPVLGSISGFLSGYFGPMSANPSQIGSWGGIGITSGPLALEWINGSLSLAANNWGGTLYLIPSFEVGVNIPLWAVSAGLSAHTQMAVYGKKDAIIAKIADIQKALGNLQYAAQMEQLQLNKGTMEKALASIPYEHAQVAPKMWMFSIDGVRVPPPFADFFGLFCEDPVEVEKKKLAAKADQSMRETKEAVAAQMGRPVSAEERAQTLGQLSFLMSMAGEKALPQEQRHHIIDFLTSQQLEPYQAPLNSYGLALMRHPEMPKEEREAIVTIFQRSSEKVRAAVSEGISQLTQSVTKELTSVTGSAFENLSELHHHLTNIQALLGSSSPLPQAQ